MLLKEFFKNIFLFISIIILIVSCSSNEPNTNTDININEEESGSILPDETDVMGYGLLEKLPGLWSGPVKSTTPAGSFNMWYVDFRPISESQVSAYSELDIYTRNFMSFFIVKHDGQYKLAFRNGGGFKEDSRIAYEVIDKVEETPDSSYYRFSDFVVGEKRVYTEMTFTENKLVMQVFTSKYNKVDPAELHMRWEPELKDIEASKDAVNKFNYPQKMMVKDFSDTFNGMPEAVYLSEKDDPYKEESQPYLGEVKVNISISDELDIDPDKEIFVLFTIQSLFEGIKYLEENLIYTSRYIYLKADTSDYTFKGMHPGTYYLYSFYDKDGDKKFLKGDYMSSDPNNILTLEEKGLVEIDTYIDFVMP